MRKKQHKGRIRVRVEYIYGETAKKTRKMGETAEKTRVEGEKLLFVLNFARLNFPEDYIFAKF